MLFEDGDEETDSYDNIQKYIERTSEYEQAHNTALALPVSLASAIAHAATMTPNAKEPNHYKDAMEAPDREAWKSACDLKMQKLRERNCWSVVKRAEIPNGTRVMGSRWTFKYKRDKTGTLCQVSHCSRFVTKGFTQMKNVHYFESFAPVASFVTLHLVFALTALPHFQVNHYDVSVAFIERKLDSALHPYTANAQKATKTLASTSTCYTKVYTAWSRAHAKCNFNLNLQYGRAFGMQVDQQQCRALREGSVQSHGFEQTLLHLTVAQASFVAKVAQEADLPLQSSLAVEHHISAQAPSTLWHGTVQQVQLGFTTRTKYHSDPSFGPTLKVAQAMRNADGSMTVRVVPTFGLVNGPGEDQQQEIKEPAGRGKPKRSGQAST
jgi:hypothetical protein